MKNYFPVIALGAAAAGVIFWLKRKAAAGQNLRYEIVDIAIDIPKIVQSNFARIYFNTKLRLINDESVSVNIRQINLNANVGTRSLGKIINNTPFSVPAKSSNVVRIETSFSSGQIVLYIIDKIKNGFVFDDPISLDGYIQTDLGRVNVDYTRNAPGGITGTYKSYDVAYKTKSGRTMIYKNIQAKSIKEAKEVVNSLMKESSSFNGAVAAFLNGAPNEHILNNIQGNC